MDFDLLAYRWNHGECLNKVETKLGHTGENEAEGVCACSYGNAVIISREED